MGLLELYFGRFLVLRALLLRNLEHRLCLEMEHSGKKIVRESLDGVVELTGCRVEVAAGCCNIVLDVGNLVLKLKEVLVRLEVGISL